MPVPLFDTATPLEPLRGELRAAALGVLDGGKYILGPEVAAFESEFAASLGARHAIGVANGTDALTIALRAMGVGPGDDVVVPSFSFYASAEAIPPTGARPVFCDIDPETFCVTPETVKAALTPATKAVMAVHLFGNVAPVAEIEALGVPVLEDAAQAAGSTRHGERAGALGAAATFSFFPSKNLGGFGDGGLVTTDNPDLAARLTCLRNHGMEPRYHHKIMGWNARLDALQAALLRVKLPHLERWTAGRQAAAQRYDALIAEHGLDGLLERPRTLPERRHVFNQYVLRVKNGRRDAVVQHLRNEKIGCEIYYPIALHLQECLRDMGHRVGDFPVSEEACREVMAPPMFPEITPEQQRRVVQAIKQALTAPARAAA